MEQLINQSLDRYKIVTLLGEGGMGAVFKARDLTLQRDVAIKIMHPHFARQPNFQERFLQEARTAARLSHASIVQVYDFGQNRGLLYIVMKFVAGDNLEKMLEKLKKQGKWLTLSESMLLVRQVSLALDYAHRQGVLHRDIKPANIMIEPESSPDAAGVPYCPIITDLGLAKLAEGGMMTMEGTSMGTPAYMSPEQALGQKTDARSDVYSLGVLLFELATGTRPFPANSLTEAIQYHTREAPPKPRAIRPDLPQPLEDTILKALEKEPAQRFQSAAELARALDSAQPATQGVASTPTAMEGAVSLMTQYQESLVEPRGNSVFEAAPPLAPASQDRIQVVFTDRTSRLLPITKQALVIGRDNSNDIPVEDNKVSRNHARIEFDGSSYRVIDLDSTNGTFIANARLLPGIAEVWAAEKTLRVGDTFLRLIRGKAGSAGSAVYRPDGTQVDPAQIASSPGDGRIGIFTEEHNPTIEPGRPTTLNLTVLNQGPTVDHFKVSLQGVPAAWLASGPPAVQLMPGAQQQLSITLQPPRTSQTRAGRYPAALSVASQDNPNQTAEARFTLTVAPFSQFSTELHPQRVKAGRPARLTVKNNGNIQETYSVSWNDRADELKFSPPAMQLRVPEGQSAIAEFRAQPKERKLIGGQSTHAFTARVAAPLGDPQTQAGELLSTAILPLWLVPVMMMLCVLLVTGGGLAYAGVQNRSKQATQTAFAAETQVAAIVEGTAGARTAEALALLNANSATQQAATQQFILQSTADTAATQNAAVIQTATQAAMESQNGQTATALANAQATAAAAAQQTADAAGTAGALTQAANQTATAQAALAAEIDFFTDNWVNVDSLTGGMRRLVIQAVDSSTLSFHGYGACSPTDCDWDTINVPTASLPILEGTYDFGFVKKTITIKRAADGKRLDVTVFDDYAPGDTRTDKTTFYTLETVADRNTAMNEFVGVWYNNDPSNFPELRIAKKDDFTLTFRGFGACTPTYCDWGPIDVPFTAPVLKGRWEFGFKTTAITISRSGSNLSVDTLDDYTDARPNRAASGTFHP